MTTASPRSDRGHRAVPPKTGIFQESLDRYMAQLDPSDALWLQSIEQTSWETVIVDLDALNQSHKESSTTRKFLSRIKSFVNSLQPFFSSVDILVSANQQIAGIVWGTLKLIIQMTHNFTNYFSVLSDTLETISVELPFLQDYVDILYPDSPTIQKAVGVVCEDVLSVFLAVHRVFVNQKGHLRSSFSINLQPFRQNLNDITSHLEKHRKIVQSHVEHAERLLSKQDRDKAAETRADLELKYHTDRQREAEITFYTRVEKFQTLLAAPHCWEKHENTLKIYKQPKCWILDTPQYSEWSRDSAGPGLLWCHAKPGAGKTVLSSVIIHHLQRQHDDNPNISVVFFYCEYDNPLKRPAEKILASILNQLLFNPRVLESIKESWMLELPNLKHLGLSNLQNLIIQILQQFQHTYIVIDAIDECDSPDDIADILITLATYSSILVTSRSDSEDLSGILGHFPQIHITPEDIHNDIQFFVAYSLEKHRRLSTKSMNIKQHISDRLVTAADGM
ncbi:hypothetical protein C8J57DRAFT_1519310 [Mycena rebaudengoi]|nr:hypothetical protein C8J57DRAFT_1519310 [Mycena rebaudengoi]